MRFFSKRHFFRIIFICAVIGALLFVSVLWWVKYAPMQTIERYGVTFSTVYAESLGLHPLESYKNILDELGVKAVRIPVYWSELEGEKGIYDWGLLDALMKESEKRHVDVTLVVGQKVPRWPECFLPSWAQKESALNLKQDRERMIKSVVERYQNSPALERWQIENEPHLLFGVCPQMTDKDLQDEINLVQSQDAHPIQLTASGEIGPWKNLASTADVFGISLYRLTWNRTFGYFTYPLTPLFYRVRIALLQLSIKTPVIISELQAEPWFSEDRFSQPVSYWAQKFSAQDFQKNVRFAQQVGVSEVYLWGVEWWIYAKQNGDDSLWMEASLLFHK